MPAGRPRVDIDQDQFERLCAFQCPLTEIADWFNCSEDTIERWCKREYGENFAEVFAKKRGRGKIALRRAQFELAKKNATMAIFLGRQYLGQSENGLMVGVSTEADDELTLALEGVAAEMEQQNGDE